MKIFITKNNPNTHFIYTVLRFIRKHCTEKEFLFYVEETCKEAREKRDKKW